MWKILVVLIAVIGGLGSIGAAAEDLQADSFARIYASVCLKNLSHLDGLRDKLRLQPKLAPDQAAAFLQGLAGSAWPVPDKNGTFVVAVPDNKKMCLVYARRVGADAAEERFRKMAATSPDPLVSRSVMDKWESTATNGKTHTIGYEWSVPDAPEKMLFILVTAKSESAELQGLASASYVQGD